MGRAELLILLGAIVIYGTFTLSVNESSFENEMNMLQSQFELTAIAIANSYFEEARARNFDEASVSTYPTTLPDDFTAPGSLGAETGENYPNFDDIDDYDDYTTTSTAPNGFDYTITVEIGYVTDSDVTTFSGTRTFHKRMNVTISSQYLSDDITLSRLFSFVG